MLKWFFNLFIGTKDEDMYSVTVTEGEIPPDNDTIEFNFCPDNIRIICPRCSNEFKVEDMKSKNNIMTLYKSKITSRFRLNLICPNCRCRFEKYYKITEVIVTKVKDISTGSKSPKLGDLVK